MKQLNQQEAQSVSGGYTPEFFLSFCAGMQGLDRSNTIKYSAMWVGTLGGFFSATTGALVFGAPDFLTFGLTGGLCGAAFGAAEGFVGYSLGTLFQNPEHHA